MRKEFLGRILKFIKEEKLVSRGDRVLIALSGGPDSVFLVEILDKIAPILNINIGCAHINHGIREDALKDELFVKKYCERKKIPIVVRKIEDLNPHMSSLEEKAREKRYQILEEIRKSEGFNLLATAHTMDDSVETIIHSFLRGTGLKGLAGILPKRGHIIRPLLVIRKSEILNVLKEEGIEYVIDHTNFDEKFTRNYIRRKIIPAFEHVNPKFVEHIFKTSMIIKSHFEWVENVFQTLRNNEILETDWIDVYMLKDVNAYHPDVLIEFLKWYLDNEPAYEEIRQFLAMVTRKKRGLINIKGMKIGYSHGELAFYKKAYRKSFVFKSENDVFVEKDLNYIVRLSKGRAEGDMECNIEPDMLPFELRFRRRGDRIGHKKLKDRFIALKIPYWRRDFWPVFEKNGKIFFIPGIYKEVGLKGSLKLEVKKYEREKFSIFD